MRPWGIKHLDLEPLFQKSVLVRVISGDRLGVEQRQW